MKFISLKEVIKTTGLSRSTIYNYINEGKFPKQCNMGGRSVRWLESEVMEWLNRKLESRFD